MLTVIFVFRMEYFRKVLVDDDSDSGEMN